MSGREESRTKPVRLHYRLTGSVQGVGLRFRAQYAARLWGLSGWVRNCEDGSVELELEGRQDAIAGALDSIEQGTFIRIESWEVTERPVTGECGFRVRG